jgi:cell division protein FtsB
MSASIRKSRSRLRQIVLPLIGALTVFYFGYHAIEGERGLLAWVRLSDAVEEAGRREAALANQRAVLENRVARLKPDSLDLDLLDERARAVLNLAEPDELILYDHAKPR